MNGPISLSAKPPFNGAELVLDMAASTAAVEVALLKAPVICGPVSLYAGPYAPLAFGACTLTLLGASSMGGNALAQWAATGHVNGSKLMVAGAAGALAPLGGRLLINAVERVGSATVPLVVKAAQSLKTLVAHGSTEAAGTATHAASEVAGEAVKGASVQSKHFQELLEMYPVEAAEHASMKAVTGGTTTVEAATSMVPALTGANEAAFEKLLVEVNLNTHVPGMLSAANEATLQKLILEVNTAASTRQLALDLGATLDLARGVRPLLSDPMVELAVGSVAGGAVRAAMPGLPSRAEQQRALTIETTGKGLRNQRPPAGDANAPAR